MSSSTQGITTCTNVSYFSPSYPGNDTNVNESCTVYEQEQSLVIDYSIKNNRLYEKMDGSIGIITKTPAQVFGERVVRPFINGGYDLSKCAFEILSTGFSYLNKFISSINFIPVAEAQPVDLQQNQPNCAPLRALDNAVKNSKSNAASIGSTKSQDLKKSFPSLKPLKTFSSREEAGEYVKEVTGIPVSNPQTSCAAEDFIHQIRELKKPNTSEMNSLENAYANLKNLSKNDSLERCYQQILDLLEEIDRTIGEYHINALNELPDLIASLLQNSKTGVTTTDVSLLITHSYEISKKMVLDVGNTNVVTAHWIAVLVWCAEKNSNFVTGAFETVIALLEKGNSIPWEQIKAFRRLADLSKNKADVSQYERQLAEKMYELTDSRIFFVRWINSYLEPIPTEIMRWDLLLQDIKITLLGTRIAKDVEGVALGTLLFVALSASSYGIFRYLQSIKQNTKNNIDKARDFTNSGQQFYLQGNLNAAKNYYEQALNIFIKVLKIENHIEVAQIYDNLGIILLRGQEDANQVIEYFNKALNIKIELRLETENPASVAMTYVNLGDAYLRLQKLQQALECYTKAKGLSQQVHGNENDSFFDNKILQCQTV